MAISSQSVFFQGLFFILQLFPKYLYGTQNKEDSIKSLIKTCKKICSHN